MNFNGKGGARMLILQGKQRRGGVENLVKLDRRLYLLCQRKLRWPWFSPMMVWLTSSGTKGSLWIILAGGLLLAGTQHGRVVAGLSVASLLCAEGLINLLLKPLVARERPYSRYGLKRLLVEAPGAYSWPSAHAGSSMAAALVLGYGYPNWAFVLLLVAALLSYSRVYVGVHYPLDVLAGAALGIACATAILAFATAGLHLI